MAGADRADHAAVGQHVEVVPRGRFAFKGIGRIARAHDAHDDIARINTLAFAGLNNNPAVVPRLDHTDNHNIAGARRAVGL